MPTPKSLDQASWVAENGKILINFAPWKTPLLFSYSAARSFQAAATRWCDRINAQQALVAERGMDRFGCLNPPRPA